MPVVGANAPSIPVPVGGAASDRLEKLSAADGVVGWDGIPASQSWGLGGTGMYPSGSWHCNQTTPVDAVNATYNSAVTYGTSRFQYLWLPRPVMIDAYGLTISNSTFTTTMHVWAMTLDPATMKPDQVIGPEGTVDGTNATAVTIPLSQPATLPAGGCFLAVGVYNATSGSPKLGGAGIANTGGSYRLAMGSSPTANPSVLANYYSCWEVANAYQPKINPPSAYVSDNSYPFPVWFRVA